LVKACARGLIHDVARQVLPEYELEFNLKTFGDPQDMDLEESKVAQISPSQEVAYWMDKLTTSIRGKAALVSVRTSELMQHYHETNKLAE